MNNYNGTVKILLLSFWAIAGFCLLGSLLFVCAYSYSEMVTVLLEKAGKQGWEDYFGQKVLSREAYACLPYFIAAVFAVWLCCSYWLRRHIDALVAPFANWLLFLKQRILKHKTFASTTEQYAVYLLMMVFLLKGLFFMYRYELQYDEAWTYNHFVSRGLLVSMFSPNNNHILYSIFACITDLLPLDGKYSLRLPVLIGGWMALMVFYAMAKSIFGWPSALVAAVFFAFSPAVVQYSLYARGYIFQLLFTLLAGWSTLRLSENPKQVNYWFCWVLAMVLGVYSVPTHLMTYAVFSLLLLIAIFAKGHSFRYYLYANISVFATLFLLFLPFILTGGWQQMTASVSVYGGDIFWAYQDKVSDWLLWGGGRGTSVYFIWLVLMFLAIPLLGIAWYSPTQKRSLLGIVVMMALPSLLNLMTGLQPQFRIWCFLTPFIALLLAAFCFFIASKIKKTNFVAWLSIPLAVCLIYRMEQHYAIRWSAQLDINARKIAHLMMQKQIDSCYVFANYDKPLLTYYYLRSAQKIQLFMPYQNSRHYAPFIRQPLFAAVLWDKEDAKPSAAQKAWFQQYYPVIIYQDKRIELRLPEG